MYIYIHMLDGGHGELKDADEDEKPPKTKMKKLKDPAMRI